MRAGKCAGSCEKSESMVMNASAESSEAAFQMRQQVAREGPQDRDFPDLPAGWHVMGPYIKPIRAAHVSEDQPAGLSPLGGWRGYFRIRRETQLRGGLDQHLGTRVPA